MFFLNVVADFKFTTFILTQICIACVIAHIRAIELEKVMGIGKNAAQASSAPSKQCAHHSFARFQDVSTTF